LPKRFQRASDGLERRLGDSIIMRLFSDFTMSLSPILTPSLERTLWGIVT